MGEKKGKGKGLYNRDDQGDYWWELRDCAYYGEFEKEKIVYPNMTKYRPFLYDTERFYTNQKCYIMTGNTSTLKYLIALLNSWLFDFAFKDYFPELLGGTRELSKVFFETIPLPKIPENAQQPFITLVDQILSAKQKDPNADTSALERQIDKMVYKLYDLTPDNIAVVEWKG